MLPMNQRQPSRKRVRIGGQRFEKSSDMSGLSLTLRDGLPSRSGYELSHLARSRSSSASLIADQALADIRAALQANPSRAASVLRELREAMGC